MASSALANDVEVTRQLLRIPATEPSDLSAALNAANWQTVGNFGVHGYDNGIFWLHLTVQSKLSSTQRLVVRNLYALHDKVDFYLLDGDTLLEHWPMGDTLDNPGWVFADKNFAIPITLEPHAKKQVYIRIEGMNTKMLKTNVITYEQMQSSIHWSRLIFGAIYGIMLVMALYNLIIGIFTRDKAYVLYACQVTFFCIFIMSINGDGRYYLWRDYADFNHYAIQAFGVLYVFFIILFPWYLLKLSRYSSGIKYFFYFLGLVEFLFALSVLTLPYGISMRIAVAISMLLSPILLLMGLYLVVKRVPVAGIYTFAWSFYLVGATLVGLAAANIVEMNVFTLNGGAVGGIIEQILLSIALAKRIEIERHEKFSALQHANEAETEAARQRKHFEDLFERAPVGIVTLNDQSRITSINPKGCELLEFESPQQARNITERFSTRFSTRDQIRSAMLEQGKIIDHETIITTQKGNVKHCTITLIKQHDDNVSFEGYITDISERKKAQTILHAVEEERMNALEQLVTGVAHEINTPLGINLTSISFAQGELNKLNEKFLQGSLTKSTMTDYVEESGRALSLMQNSLEQISVLVSRFKQVSFKHAAPKKQNINLKSHIHAAFLDALKDKNAVIYELKMPSSESMNIYPDLLEIILKQLIENSLIHGFKNSDHGHISLDVNTDNQRIRMEYRDNGTGVDQAIKANVFNPFVTSDRGNANHSGLGLYRIYNLVTQVLKGKIQLLDETGFAICIEFEI
jgi:PAS domain S-box-containing protein